MDDAEATPPRPTPRRSRRRAVPPDALRGKLRAHDPFELIRWLALSQSDPRKALAELVQNSLDADARQVWITRVREHGLPCMKIFDDGQGVIPEMDRPSALKYIATHIGHSRKRSLSPGERLELMTQGLYGIGLLGFWSLGERLEMRSAVPGQPPYRLVLHRDRPDYLVEPLRERLSLDEHWTEVVVLALHAEARGALLGRRAADYLGSELRGQLLDRDVELTVDDRMSRGKAQKLIVVKPPRFVGERIESVESLAVPGRSRARLEVYLRGGDDAEGLAVYSSGTLVAESFAELHALGLDRFPWTDGRLTGMVDFPDFEVAPGNRRGILLDDAARAFAGALATVEPLLEEAIAAEERRRNDELDRSLVRDLQRAFRHLHRSRPRYSLLPLPPRAAPGTENDREGNTSVAAGDVSRARRAIRNGDLLPAGPAAAVRLRPSPVRVGVSDRQRIEAIAVDAAGRVVDGPVRYRWRVSRSVGRIEPLDGDAGRVVLQAASSTAAGTLHVEALDGDASATAEAEVVVLDHRVPREDGAGIPEPELVERPAAAWRSRLRAGRWQINAAHPDYRSVVGHPTLKLRYLAMLFAKEVVLRSRGDCPADESLEQLVEVLLFAERNMARGRGRAPKRDND
jgi:hypothetical protein